MSLKSTFLAFKKSCTSCPKLGGGGGGNLGKIQKNKNFFFVKPSLTGTLGEAFGMLMLRTVHSLVISFCTLACLLSLHLIKAFIWSKPPGCKLVSSLVSLLFFVVLVPSFTWYPSVSFVSLVFFGFIF